MLSRPALTGLRSVSSIFHSRRATSSGWLGQPSNLGSSLPLEFLLHPTTVREPAKPSAKRLDVMNGCAETVVARPETAILPSRKRASLRRVWRKTDLTGEPPGARTLCVAHGGGAGKDLGRAARFFGAAGPLTAEFSLVRTNFGQNVRVTLRPARPQAHFLEKTMVGLVAL